MSKTRVEFQIKGLDRYTVVAVSDFPYRLNRIAFVTTADKMKALGGTLSTKIKLEKDNANNNRIFIGKTDFKSYGKFNESTDYPAVIKENGGVIARGVFRLDKVTARSYEGTFFDFDSSWIESLNKVKLNRLGYFDGSPTWTADFNGAETFDEVNDKTNRETDFVCPTALYNNTPILDYLDKTDYQIWGTYETSSGIPLQDQPPEQFPNDFDVIQGFHATLRHGLKFDHFPPALYYRNVIEKVAAEIGYSVDCPLFYTDWFNALVMAYTGDGYIYNWKRIGTVSSNNPNVQQAGEGNFDEIDRTEPAEPSQPLSLNKLMLPQTDQAPTHVWILEEQFTFSLANVIKHDDVNTLIDPVTLTNSFDRQGAYLVPRDGSFRINVTSQYMKELSDKSYYEPFSFYWDGGFLFNAFGGWDANSDRTTTPDVRDRWYGWDDNVLIVARADKSGKVSDEALEKVYKWMNGQDKSLTTTESDIIAYFSPKRYDLMDNGANIPDAEIIGSPYNDFNKTPSVNLVVGASGEYVGHYVTNAADPRDSSSFASISIEADLNEGDHIKIFWVSLVNIYGLVVRDAGVDPFYEYAFNRSNTTQQIGLQAADNSTDVQRAQYSIEYLCGDDKLDLAANLPDMSAKDFIGDFMKTFNLHPIVQGKTISFYPIKQYYSPIPYDITSRVDTSKNWEATPIKTPSKWAVGYSNDKDDYLLKKSTKRVCARSVLSESSDYGNVEIGNENVYSKDTKYDFNMFSATKFVKSQIALNPWGFGVDSFPYVFETSTNPAFFFDLIKGFKFEVIAANGEANYFFPSIMSQEQHETEKYGDWFLEFNKTPRLFYHLGTINQYTTSYNNNNWGHMIDMPRPDVAFMNLSKHWFRPTVSQFDGENAALTGINYPTLRFDGENGLFNRYFENLLEFFNLSEQLTLRAALTPKDWNELKGNRKVRFLGQLYRLMQIKDYDPETRNKCIIQLLKEV